MRPILVLALTYFVLDVSFLCIVTGQNTYNESDIEQLTRLMDKVNLTANASDLIEERGNWFCDWALSMIARKDIPCDAINSVTKCIGPNHKWYNPGGKDCVSEQDMGILQNFDTSNSANLCDKRVSFVIDCIYYDCKKVMGERYATAIREIKDIGCAHLDILTQMDACKNSHLSELRQTCGDSIKSNGEPMLGDIMKQLKQIDGLCVKFTRAADCVIPILEKKCNHIMKASTYYSSKGWAFFNVTTTTTTPTTTTTTPTTTTTTPKPTTTTPTTSKPTTTTTIATTETTQKPTTSKTTQKPTTSKTTQKPTTVMTTQKPTTITTTQKRITSTTTQKPTTTSTPTATTKSFTTEKRTEPTTETQIDPSMIPTFATKPDKQTTKTESAKTVSMPGQKNTRSKTEITAKMATATGITLPEESDGANSHGLDLFLAMIALGLSMRFGYDAWQALEFV